mmetsp:Transcript_16848/g.40097  ORF Transcript_16848/g.40097 Transcript_16848/m.40097 type:complete len:221 (-) Transcript_16848:2165-2827(-)
MERERDRYGGVSGSIDEMFSVKVDNISGVIREDEVRKVFEHFGPVGDVHIPKAPGSNESRGFFFVRYYYEAHAKKAVRTLNGQRFHGQLMQMNLARNPPPVGAGPKSNIVGTSQIRPREREPPAPPPPPPPPPPPHRSRCVQAHLRCFMLYICRVSSAQLKLQPPGILLPQNTTRSSSAGVSWNEITMGGSPCGGPLTSELHRLGQLPLCMSEILGRSRY